MRPAVLEQAPTGLAERPPEPPPWLAHPAVLAAVGLALALLLYLPTLGSSWGYDDIDYINQAADVLAGKRGFWEVVFRPQGEHIVAGFRLVLFASLRLFGIAAFPFRLLVLVAHAASAFQLGMLARRYTGAAAAGFAATTLYAGACGLSSMWIWFPSGSSVPLAMAALTGATLALAHRDRLGRRRARLLTGVAVVVALLTESTLAPLVLVPIAIDEVERRREGAGRWSLGAFTGFCLLAAAGVSLLATTLYHRTFGPSVSVSVLHGAPRAAFLVLSAPFRLFFPGVSILTGDAGLRTGLQGMRLGVVVGAAVSALLLVLWRRGAPRLAAVAALTALGPLGWLGVVGLGRWRSSYWEMYDADRYYFPLLVPLALLAGAVAATAAERLAGWPRRARAALLALLLVGLAGEVTLHRRAMLGRIPFDVYAAHENRFAQLAALARRLERVAAALPSGHPPLQVPDAALWFPDVHNGYIGTPVLVHAIARGGGRLRLGPDHVEPRDARLLRPALIAWAREIGEPLPYLSIDESGRLTDAHVVRNADFRHGPGDHAVVRGFFPWEGTARWMGASGELRLTLACTSLTFLLAAPVDELRRAGILEPVVRVQVTDEATGWSTGLGTVRVTQPGAQTYRLDAAPFNGRLGNGRVVHLRLEADRTWRPAGVIPGSGDTRDLSVMVLSAGCD